MHTIACSKETKEQTYDMLLENKAHRANQEKGKDQAKTQRQSIDMYFKNNKYPYALKN